MEKNQVTLEEVFAPRGVAIVGVSGSGLSFAGNVVQSLKAAGFPNIYPVNPNHSEILGLPCYPNLMSIPGEVDHVVVNIPAEASLALMDDCASKGVKSVHFFTARFGESGLSERADLERALLKKARDGGFRIIGPNCVGLFVPKSRLVNSGGVPLEPGPIAFMSQSGGHAQNLPSYSAQRGLTFSKVVSYGNALDVDECELLEYFADDKETDFIAAYIEGVKDGRRFFKALKQAVSKKPVVIYKGGATKAGQRAAYGHTASMTSSAAIFDSFCRQAGAIKVDDVDQMIDALVALRWAKPLPTGTGVALIGAGGGPSVMASDELEKAGLVLPRLSEKVQAELKRHLPLAGSIFINPIDTPNLTTPEAVTVAMRVMGAQPEIHMLVYHLGFHPIGSWGYGRFFSEEYRDALINSFLKAREVSNKPVLLALRPGQDMPKMEEFLVAQEAFVKAGLPVFHSLSSVASAMARVAQWHQKALDRSSG